MILNPLSVSTLATAKMRPHFRFGCPWMNEKYPERRRRLQRRCLINKATLPRSACVRETDAGQYFDHFYCDDQPYFNRYDEYNLPLQPLNYLIFGPTRISFMASRKSNRTELCHGDGQL